MKNLLLFISLMFWLANLKAQTHPIEVHANNRVASLQMTAQEYSDWIDNNEYTVTDIREALFQDIYQKFNDQFDFIFLILNEDTRPDNLPFGQLIQVSNAVSGIGLSMFDNSANYGSDGQLMAVMHLTQRNYLRSGPSLHELMHNWGNFGIPTESVSAPGTGLMSFPFIPHWGFTGGSTPGQLGGFEQSTLVDNGSGSYTVDAFGPNANGGNSVPFNETELYLMGMKPISSVTDFDVFADITSLTINPDDFDFEASSRTTYTSESLESLLGARVPASSTSQKDFTALIIVLTDAPLTTAEWDQVDGDAEKFSRTSSDGSSTYNFWEATDQMGTIDFTIDCSVTGTDIQAACDSLVWIDGVTYTSNNNTATFNIMGGATNGCDSVVTLDLTILHSTTGTDIQTACNTFDWIDGNTYTSSNNTATFNIEGGATNGCDSVVTLDLTILLSTTGTDVQTACDAFVWIDGITYTSSNNTATFNIIGGAANSCDSLVLLDLTIVANDLGVTASGETISAVETNATYRWLDCDNGYAFIVGETHQSFIATSSGSYAVELTQGLCIDTSDCVMISITGLAHDIMDSQISVFPNPATDVVTVEVSKAQLSIEVVALYNALGQEVMRYDMPIGHFRIQIDLRDYSSGVYFLGLRNDRDQMVIKRIVIN